MAFLFGGKQMDPQSARRARYKFEGEMKNSQLMMPDWCALQREFIYVESVSRRSQHQRKSYQPRAARVAAGVCAIWFSLFAAGAASPYIYESARGCNSSRRVYILEYCVTGKFLSKKAVILHNLPGFM
jgi:hypothetical protein